MALEPHQKFTLSSMEKDRTATHHSRNDELLFGAQMGNVDLVIMRVEHGANVNATMPKTKKTPLMLASENGHVAVCRVLIAKGADVNCRDVNGHTCLTLAAINAQDDVIEFLVKHGGADVNEQSPNDGFTALMLAAKAGHAETVERLLSLKADPDLRNDNGFTALGITNTLAVRKVLCPVTNWFHF